MANVVSNRLSINLHLQSSTPLIDLSAAANKVKLMAGATCNVCRGKLYGTGWPIVTPGSRRADRQINRSRT